MSPTSILISRSRRFLQTTDIDAFNGIPEASISAAAARKPTTTAPFDSSMALTILLLLTAFFFLAFFSLYIRRFATSAAPPPPPPPNGKGGRGLDRSTVDSLPLVAYGGAAKHPMIEDCRICLSDFSESETVKLIPYCGHVFHPTCLDTWLAAHVTCPLCRSADLFDSAEQICLDVAPHRNDARALDIGQRSTVGSVRRACSCSDLANRAALQRSTSF